MPDDIKRLRQRVGADTTKAREDTERFERGMHQIKFEKAQRDGVQKLYGAAIKQIDDAEDAPMLGRETAKSMTFMKRQKAMANLKPMGHAERMFADTVPDKPIIPKAKENADKRKAAAAERDERGKEAYEWVVDENEKRDAKRLAKYGKIAVRGGN